MKRSPIRKVSKKGALRHRAYMKVRKAYLEEHPICEVCGDRMATQIHHRRGRTSTLLCDDRYFLAVCSVCHETLHLNPAWSMKKGYSIDRLSK